MRTSLKQRTEAFEYIFNGRAVQAAAQTGEFAAASLIQMAKTYVKFRINRALERRQGNSVMIAKALGGVAFAWNFLFNHRVSPVRNIPDVAMQHYVLQALGLMWAVSFSLAIGSYTFLAWSVIGHTVLIAAAAITVATLTTAAKYPRVFVRPSGRGPDGEHD